MSQPAQTPTVYIVEVLPDDDYESTFDTAQVFDNEDAANEYAAQFVAPKQARVYPLPLLTAAPAVATLYRLSVGVPASTNARAAMFLPPFYDPATEVPDVQQVDESDTAYATIIETGKAKTTVETIETAHGMGLVHVQVAGTDKDAVQAAFVTAFNQVQAEIADRPEVAE